MSHSDSFSISKDFNFKDYVDINCGKYHNLGIKIDGSVVAWGDNTFKQCELPKLMHFIKY